MVIRGPRRRSGGFTLLEVLIALLIAMIGLMGTLAVQQSMLNATYNANDSSTAMRLAMEKFEQFAGYVTIPPSPCPGTPTRDLLATIKQTTPAPTSGDWSGVEYQDAFGKGLTSADVVHRFKVERWVYDTGANLPYALSVQVSYALDSGNVKTVRIDGERRKCW